MLICSSFDLLFYSIDATEEPKRCSSLGRLVNHGRKDYNAKMKVQEIDQSVCLCLYACRDIEAGEEILYNYGLKTLPWEVKVTTCMTLSECIVVIPKSFLNSL
jgi:hypothetical protein